MKTSQAGRTSRRRFLQSATATVGLALGDAAPAAMVALYHTKPRAAAFDYRVNAFDSAALDLHSKYSISVLNMLPSQAAAGAPGSNFLLALKARNPKILVGQYVILSQMFDEATAPEFARLSRAISAGGVDHRDWWARAGSRSPVAPGAKTKSAGVKQYAAWEVNQTEFVTPDALGRRVPECIADGYRELMLGNLYAGGLDLVFNDNVWGNPGSQSCTGSDGVTNFPKGTVANYDLDEAGTNDPSSSTDWNLGVSPSYRRGYARFVSRLKSSMPRLQCIANADHSPSFTSCLTTPELFRKYDYAFLEALTSKGYSVDTWRGSFKDTLALYRSQLSGVTKSVFVNAYLDTARDSLGRTLQKARYGLGVAMMDDGYAVIADQPGGAAMRPYWFDELGMPIGPAVEAGPREPWMSGLWRRRYANGCVIVNPSSNGGRWMNNAPGTLTLVRSGNTVTLHWSAMPNHGKDVGDLIRIQDCSTDPSFNGVFEITAVSDGGRTITWHQNCENCRDSALSKPAGFWGVQTTVDISREGYFRIQGTDDPHNDYDGGTSQNDGSPVTSLNLWPNDAILLLTAWGRTDALRG